MERQYVQSSDIKSVGFDQNSSILEVEFHSGSTWQYFDVMESTYYEMVSASSVGKFFHANIKGQYEESRVG